MQIFDQAHTAQRIIFTETRKRNGLHGLLVWFVAKHKHVSKCIDLIYSSNGRLNPKKRPTSARSLFAQANNEEKLLDDHIVLLNPAANTPLKIYNADIRMLGSEESLGKLALRLTSDEKAIITMPGTVLVLGRSVCNIRNVGVTCTYGNLKMSTLQLWLWSLVGEQLTLANDNLFLDVLSGNREDNLPCQKMAYDRQQHQDNFNLDVPHMSQLFVAHSPRIYHMVGTLQGCPDGLASAGTKPAMLHSLD